MEKLKCFRLILVACMMYIGYRYADVEYVARKRWGWKIKGVCEDCGEESDDIKSIPGIRYMGKIDLYFCPDCYDSRIKKEK